MRLTGLWWWIDRWRKSSAFADMTLEEQGAYRNLLDEACLRKGPIPNDERILAKACGDALRWRKVRTVVLARFTLTSSGWRNETLDEVLRESQRRADKQRSYRNKIGNEYGNDNSNGGGNGLGDERGNLARPPDPDPDPVLKNVQAAAAPRLSIPKPPRPSEQPTPKQLQKLAHTVIETHVGDDFAEWKALMKDECGKMHWTYDGETVGGALESALVQRSRKSGAR